MTPTPTTPAVSLVPDLPTITDIDRISRLENAVIRNLQITQCYFELSKAFSQRTGVCANWCTFATWASKQAGVSIRGEDLRRALETALTAEPEVSRHLFNVSTLLRSAGSEQSHTQIQNRFVSSMAKAATERVGDAIARGNRKVFEEIGREFARFLATCCQDPQYREETIQAFCQSLREGEPPEGQVYLRTAFSSYYGSFFETDARKRQELVLLANIEIGFHEQTRLQPEISESLNAALVDPEGVKQVVNDVLLNQLGLLGNIVYALSVWRGKKSLLNKAIDALVAVAQQHLRRLLTAELMTLTLPPARRLRLGKDLVASFPPDLQKLDNADLLALLTRIDPTADSVAQSGATDWADLRERLHYIADLFRCFHEDKDLLSEAFTPAQVLSLKAGRLPEGKL